MSVLFWLLIKMFSMIFWSVSYQVFWHHMRLFYYSSSLFSSGGTSICNINVISPCILGERSAATSQFQSHLFYCTPIQPLFSFLSFILLLFCLLFFFLKKNLSILCNVIEPSGILTYLNSFALTCQYLYFFVFELF